MEVEAGAGDMSLILLSMAQRLQVVRGYVAPVDGEGGAVGVSDAAGLLIGN